MIKVENIEISGFEAAARSARNPLNSWSKSDSGSCFNLEDCPEYCPYVKDEDECTGPVNPFIIGSEDLKLLRRLANAGDPSHRKYLRMIHVSMDVTAPLYWWKEYDTYKVGTVANSCSTMHKIAAKEFTLDDFSHEHLCGYKSGDETQDGTQIMVEGDYEAWPIDILEDTIQCLNHNREKYLETKDKKFWWQMIQLLPSSYNQKRTIDLNYETVFTIIKQRTNHKLDEWNKLVDILKTLPYVKEIGEFAKEHSLVTNRDKLKEVFGEDNTDIIISGASDFYKWLNEEYKKSKKEAK